MYGIKLQWKNRGKSNVHKIHRSDSPMDENNLPTPIYTTNPDETEYVDYDAPEWQYSYYRLSTELNGEIAVTDEIKRFGVESRIISGFNDGSITCYDWDADLLWTKQLGGDVFDVCFDLHGNIYASASGSTLFKLDNKGNILWEFTAHTSYIFSVCVDQNDIVYTLSYDKTVKKISSEGAELFSKSLNIPNPRYLTIDYQGNFFVSDGDDWTVTKFDSTGTEQWSFYNGYANEPKVLLCDEEGNILVGGNQNDLKKLSPTGTEIWSLEFSQSDSFIDMGILDNHIYCNDSDLKLRKIDMNGTVIWEQGIERISSNSSKFIVNSDENITLFGIYMEQATKYDSNGVVIGEKALNKTGVTRTIDVYPGKFAISQGLINQPKP